MDRERRRAERRNQSSPTPVDRRDKQRRKDGYRRETPRIPLELWMEEIAGDDVYFRRSGNISEGGVFFDRAIPHALGTTVTLKFALPGDSEMVVARGKVVSIAGGVDGLGMGIKFITVEGDGEKRLHEHLRRYAE